LYARSSFRKSIKLFDDPNNSYLKEIFQVLNRLNSSLLMIGDSAMIQFGEYLACELRRLQFDVSTSKHRLPIAISLPNKYISTRKNNDNNIVPVHFHLARLADNYTINSVSNKIKEIIVTEGNTITILMHIGLWYNDNDYQYLRNRPTYQTHMKLWYDMLDSFGSQFPNKTFIIFRYEVSAQHWNNSGSSISNGYIPRFNTPDGRTRFSSKVNCAPIINTSRELDWRNYDVDQLLYSSVSSSNKYFSHPNTYFTTFPFRKLTLDLWDIHATREEEDCTHFCLTPMLYQPVFSFIRDHLLQFSTNILKE
jgi:hypothetical protein